MLRDDPNESSAVYLLTSDDKQTVCGTDFSPMQINFFAKNISDEEEAFHHVPGKGKDQVSMMFIKHQRKTTLCRFCSLRTPIFFVIPLVY